MTHPWYSPAKILMRLLKWAVNATADPNMIAAGCFAYGAVDLLGVTGTVKLILNLRRKHATNTAKKKNVRDLRHGT